MHLRQETVARDRMARAGLWLRDFTFAASLSVTTGYLCLALELGPPLALLGACLAMLGASALLRMSRED